MIGRKVSDDPGLRSVGTNLNARARGVRERPRVGANARVQVGACGGKRSDYARLTQRGGPLAVLSKGRCKARV